MRLMLRTCSSLKDKRRVVRSAIDKLKNRYNVAVAEVDEQDSCKSAVIGMACVSNDAAHARDLMDEAARWIEHNVDGAMWYCDIDLI